MPSGIYKRTDEARKNMSNARKCKSPWNKGLVSVMVAWNKGLKTGIVPKSVFKKGDKFWLGKDRFNMRGKNHFNWKGGISRNRHSLSNPEYKKWRNEVFERDEYSCQDCGLSGVYLEAHHILKWSDFPESRYDVSNGLTLCKECHKLTSNYTNKKQYAIL